MVYRQYALRARYQAVGPHIEVERGRTSGEGFASIAENDDAHAALLIGLGDLRLASLPSVRQFHIGERKSLGQHHVKLQRGIGCLGEGQMHGHRVGGGGRQAEIFHSQGSLCRGQRQVARQEGGLAQGHGHDMYGIAHRNALVAIHIGLIAVEGFVLQSHHLVHHAHRIGRRDSAIEVGVALGDGYGRVKVEHLLLCVQIIRAGVQPGFHVGHFHVVGCAVAPHRTVVLKRRTGVGEIIVHKLQHFLLILLHEVAPDAIVGALYGIAIIKYGVVETATRTILNGGEHVVGRLVETIFIRAVITIGPVEIPYGPQDVGTMQGAHVLAIEVATLRVHEFAVVHVLIDKEVACCHLGVEFVVESPFHTRADEAGQRVEVILNQLEAFGVGGFLKVGVLHVDGEGVVVVVEFVSLVVITVQL